MRIALALSVVMLGMILVACGGSSTTEFNLTGSTNWQVIGNVLFGSDGVILKSAPKAYSLIKQDFKVVPQKSYEIIVVAKRAGAAPSSTLNIDFWGPGYDNAEQEFNIAPAQLKSEFSTFTNVIQSADAPTNTVIRVFTGSTNAIVVKNLTVRIVK